MSDPTEPPSNDSAHAEESFSALFAASERKGKAEKITIGDVVSGKVIAFDPSTVFVAIGDKAEATMDAAEFRDSATGEVRVAVGDEIEATVVDDGSRSGTPVLRRSIGRHGHNTAELEQALAHGLAIEGLVTAEVKGGFEVLFGAIRAFCPGSQIDSRRGGEWVAASEYIGRRLPFRITKVE